ncbi:(2Fe-2S)-binding protein [Acidisoma silvae]|uniref:(2Fe-2S)-binding protein n=1 Tax=Acidisoma silvae TaxID=2802396 RepID=A0A964DY96_9PROT|nr:(2Fe-2S)-binding protein [Acidisoma silvae]MCB8874533.1 (2Fe-2S)-binding protein [Acidisoma silvae]
MRPVTLCVNGSEQVLVLADDTPLLFILRNDFGLNGPKYGCGLGECGACTVLVDGVAARACCLPVGLVEGREITTLEGLGTAENPHPVQAAFIAEEGAQCGYCLNGMIMTVAALLARDSQPSDNAITEALRYNLCRCGAHVEILRAAKRAVQMTAQR